jgi:ectoine hydroxylase-related dioxygenase (phytanoyl-CoA dioxygenase family)
MSSASNVHKLELAARRQWRRVRRFAKDPRATMRRYVNRRRGRPAGAPASVARPSTPAAERSSGGSDSLSPAEALVENGFYIFRGQIPPSETAWIATALKHEAGIEDGQTEKSTNIDALNRFPSAAKVLLDDRLLSAVRRAIGDDARFLQVSDLHYHHDTAVWHRDSPYRAADNSASPDWADTSAPYRVVKAILYLESENAAMGIMAGSHRTPVEMDFDGVKELEGQNKHLVIKPSDDPNRRLSPDERARPIVWSAKPGDVLVFDERMYHCGRRFRNGTVSRSGGGEKFTLSFVFGGDDAHSARMYSYFRFARTELKYRALPAPIRKELARRGLVHSNGWKNHFLQHPDEVRGTWMKVEGKADRLANEYAARAAANV